VALSWVRHRPGVSSTLIGPRTPEHLESNLAGLEVELAARQTDRLDAVSEPSLNFPFDLNRQVGAMLKYAGATVDGEQSQIYPPCCSAPPGTDHAHARASHSTEPPCLRAYPNDTQAHVGAGRQVTSVGRWLSAGRGWIVRQLHGSRRALSQ
jgi:hypothetical protein